MGLETSRANTNSDITGRVAGPTQPVTIDLTDSEIESERVPLVHVDENGINHTSLVSTASGSNAQDDGHDYEGIPQMVDEVLFDSSTQPGKGSGVSVHEVGKFYSGTSGDEASGVPCDGNTVGSPQYGVNQPSTSEPIQSKGIPTSDIRHEPSGVTEGNTNVYSHRLRCGREVVLPGRFHDDGSNQQPKRKIVPKKFRDRNMNEVDTQEWKRINSIKMKHDDVEAWKKVENEELVKFSSVEAFETKPTPSNVPFNPTRRVCTNKKHDLKVSVYKARCVVQEYFQGRYFESLGILIW
ncbi:hypothetical protein JCM33374_g4675 [Metschnikowia sp. JCM 33374]|nr:hypothetical protein JCM33374_g4675 [Metschnikowia sp. JCM 33374]